MSIVVVLVALAALLVYTNPTRDDLGEFVHQYVMKESQKRMQDSRGQVLANFLGGIAGGVVSSQTVRRDYVLFSTYEVQLGKERFRALGILKNFILLEKPDLKRLKKDNGLGSRESGAMVNAKLEAR